MACGYKFHRKCPGIKCDKITCVGLSFPLKVASVFHVVLYENKIKIPQFI